MSDLVKDLREHHWCENEEWTCNNCKAADEIEQLRDRIKRAAREARKGKPDPDVIYGILMTGDSDDGN